MRTGAQTLLARFIRDRSGATAIEYGLICALMFLVIVGAVKNYGNNMKNMYQNIANAVAGAVN